MKLIVVSLLLASSGAYAADQYVLTATRVNQLARMPYFSAPNPAVICQCKWLPITNVDPWTIGLAFSALH